jgi:hypothetical protein
LKARCFIIRSKRIGFFFILFFVFNNSILQSFSLFSSKTYFQDTNDRFIAFEDVNWRKEIRSYSINSSVDQFDSYSNKVSWNIVDDSLVVKEVGVMEGFIVGVSIPIITTHPFFKFTINAKVSSDIQAGDNFWSAIFSESEDGSWKIIGKQQIVAYSEIWSNVSLRFKGLEKNQQYFLMLYYIDPWLDGWSQTISFNHLILNFFNPKFNFDWANNEPEVDSSRAFILDNIPWRKEVRTRNAFSSTDLYDSLSPNLVWDLNNNNEMSVQEQTSIFEAEYGFSTPLIMNSSSFSFQISGIGLGSLVHENVYRFTVQLSKISKDSSWYYITHQSIYFPTNWKTINSTFNDLTIGGYYRLFIYSSDGSSANWHQGLKFKDFKIYSQNDLGIHEVVDIEFNKSDSEKNSYSIIVKAKTAGELSISSGNDILYSKDVGNSPNNDFQLLFENLSENFFVFFIEITGKEYYYRYNEGDPFDNQRSISFSINNQTSASNNQLTSWGFPASIFILLLFSTIVRTFRKKKT